MRTVFLTAGALFLCLASPSMAGVAAHKITAARVFLEKMGRGDFSKLDQIYGSGFVAHGSGKSYTLDEDNASGKAIREAVPDLAVSVDHLIGEGNLVAVRWSARGTNSVAAAGMPGTGKSIAVEGMTIFRFKDGKIVEEWSLTDRLALMRQLSAEQEGRR
ncbi:ester cyclase [Sphingomonas sp.]|uniref:ester cyclase n=1 Tax=Sphingomonas sp. TaxID=28214 RepID=UPI002DE27059|nr:ester cyclase [Sphingomonas sp.]